MTLAPSDAATSEVRSVEALSTTMTSSTKSGIARNTASTPCSSFRQGMITVMDWPLYMPLTAPRYHGREMKRFWLVLCGSLLLGGELGTVRTVYLLPMGRGLDQYLEPAHE